MGTDHRAFVTMLSLEFRVIGGDAYEVEFALLFGGVEDTAMTEIWSPRRCGKENPSFGM